MSGLKLEYSISGVHNEQTLLFVHGAGASMLQFKKQELFFNTRYKVVLISLRGHGNSPKPSPNSTNNYTLNHFAEDVITLIEDLKLDKIHFIGNSAGGVVGYLVVSKIPEKCLSLITFGTTGQMKFPPFLAPAFKAFDAFMLRFFKKTYLKLMVSQTATTKASEPIFYLMFEKATAAIPHFRYHLVNYNFTPVIRQSKVPYTLIQCEHDAGINAMLGSTIKAIEVNKLANIIPLKGVGHVANLDNPDTFNSCLESILHTVKT
ncbi:MAG: alpha/beta fold hydrolase [Luteibaculaceae bacterium]